MTPRSVVRATGRVTIDGVTTHQVGVNCWGRRLEVIIRSLFTGGDA